MDLHAGSMVQHFQVLKYRLPDLVQILQGQNTGITTLGYVTALSPACTTSVVAKSNKFVRAEGMGKVNY